MWGLGEGVQYVVTSPVHEYVPCALLPLYLYQSGVWSFLSSSTAKQGTAWAVADHKTGANPYGEKAAAESKGGTACLGFAWGQSLNPPSP